MPGLEELLGQVMGGGSREEELMRRAQENAPSELDVAKAMRNYYNARTENSGWTPEPGQLVRHKMPKLETVRMWRMTNLAMFIRWLTPEELESVTDASQREGGPLNEDYDCVCAGLSPHGDKISVNAASAMLEPARVEDFGPGNEWVMG